MAVSWITASDLATPASPYAADAALTASWILYKLSGEKYPGISSSTEFYSYATTECIYSCIFANGFWTPLGIWAQTALHTHQTIPAGVLVRELRLRQTPIQTVTRVTTLDSDAVSGSYYVVNNAYLTLRNLTAWNLYSGVEVEYTHGTLPPAAARRAAIRLANELVLDYAGADSSLPERVTSITRQGLQITMLDPQEFLSKGRTGIYEVDLFLAAANPYGAKKRARVFSPDRPRGESRR